MKESNITNNDLEQLFSAVTAQSPLLSEEQVRTLLVNHPVVRPNNWVKDFFLTHLNTLLIGVSIVLVIFTATLLWVNFDDKNAQTITEYSLRENVVVPVITDTIDTVKVSHAAVNISVETDKETIEKRPEVKPVSTGVAEDSVSIADILKYHQKKLQVFTIQADRDTTLICEEGTSIEIKANSFVSENTGEEIAGNVRITVQEYYDQADIVLAGLSTTSGDKLLETGGMLHVEARAGKEKCVIKPGRNVQVGFPYSEKKEDMTLFYGKQTGTRIDWRLANDSGKDEVVIVMVSSLSEQETETFLIVEEMPEFPEGSLALRSYIDQNAIIPFSVLKDCVQGKVDMQFLVSNTGAVKNIRVLRSSNNLLDKAAVYMVSKMPKWKPGMQRGNPVNVLYRLSVSFLIPEGELSKEYSDKAKQLDENLKAFNYDVDAGFYRNNMEFSEIEKKVKKGELDEVSVSDINRYVFSATRLGWLNCDRFYQSNVPLIDFSIPVDNKGEVMATVVFNRFKAIVRGRKQQGEIVYHNMPLGEEITIVAVKTEGSKMYLAVEKTVVANNSKLVLDYKKVTMKLLRKEMTKLYQSGF